jgi:archaellum component FlaC
MTDIEKRAEELYPFTRKVHKLHLNDKFEKLRIAFIKGYSEGCEKGKEEESHNNWVMVKDAEIDRLRQRVKELERDVKEIEEDWFTRGYESIKEEVERIEGNYAELKAENEQLRKDVTEFAEWVEDRTLYFWQINTLTTADEYLKMFKEEKSVE